MEISLFEKYFLLFFVLVNFSAGFSICPPACHQMACQTGVLTCTEGGLAQIPTVLPPKTTKIILSNQKFISRHLIYSNFSNFGPPHYRVVKITIQNCELSSIASNSFSHLTDLNILDLSNNLLEEIVPDTFYSLNLKFLRLDGNKNIRFTRYSFRGLIVAELSLIDCNLDQLDYEVIKEISGSLKKFILSNNKFKVIDKNFKLLFETLPDLQINDNPFNCSCDLQWLGSVLLWRKKRPDIVSTGTILNDPQCNYPDKFKGRIISDLDKKDFKCDLPRLQLIDVFMTSNVSARLTCRSEPNKYSISDVIWLIEKNNKYIEEVQSKENAALSVSRRSKSDQYKCIIINNNGNVTVLVTISWPPNNSDNTSQTLTTFNVLNPHSNHYPPVENITVNTMFNMKRFTLLEMIGGVVGTFTVTMILFLCIYRHLAVTMKRNDKKKWYISYETAVGTDSQTYDVPNNSAGPYYPGQLLTNHYSPARYLDYNSHTSQSTPNKIAAI